MGEHGERLGRVSKAASVVVWVVQAVLLAGLGYTIYSSVTLAGPWNANNVIQKVTNSVSILLLMLLFLVAYRLLQSVRRERSPFTPQNVKRLNHIALLLVGVAVVQTLAAVLPALWWMPEVMSGGSVGMIALTVMGLAVQYFPLVLLVVSVVVWCVSLAFQHGAALQRQSDETL